MGAVDALLDRAARDVRSRRDSSMTDYLTPRFPACVFYCGEGSARFHADILSGLRDGWGGCADKIPYYVICRPDALSSLPEDESGEPFVQADTGSPAGVGDLQQAVQGMMTKAGVFEDMGQCMLFFVVDTEGMSVSEFRAWYGVVGRIEAVLKGVSARTLLLALLDNSLGKANAAEITATLNELYADPNVAGANRHCYDGVFLYGNLSKGRGFNKLHNAHSTEENGDWDVLSSVMLLADAPAAQSDACDAALFSAGRIPAVSCAFKQVEKPRRDIVSVVLRHLAAVLDHEHARLLDEQPDRDIMASALGFSAGHSVFIDECQQVIAEVERGYAGYERYLPSMSPQTEIAGATFEQVDKASCGCLSAFVQENQLKKLRQHMGIQGSSGLAERIGERMRQCLTAPQLLALRREDWKRRVDELYGESYSSKRAAQRPVREAVTQMLRVEAAQGVQAQTLRVVDELYDAAEQTEDALNRLLSEISLGTSVNEEGSHVNLNGFYGQIADAYLADRIRADRLFEAVARIGNTLEDMIQILHDQALLPLFDSEYGGVYPFKLTFMEEQVQRLGNGKSDDVAQTIVGRELVEDMDNYVGYSSLVPFEERTCEAYLLHNETGASRRAAQKLHAYLENLGKPSTTNRVFLNAGPQDCATSLWFYALDTSHLTA